MKFPIAFVALGSILLTPVIRAESTPPANPGMMRHHRKTTELGKHMEKMGHAFRALGRQVGDPAKNADSLKLVHTIRTNAEAAAKLKPEKLADIPADQQAKFLSDYHKQMEVLLDDLGTLEHQLNAGDNAGASAQFQRVKHDMFQGHKAFRKKHDEM